MLVGLGHIDLVCRDVEQSLAFYAAVFGELGLQPPHHERVVLQSVRRLEQLLEHLVVARRRQVEAAADRDLFRAGLGPPRALEVENRPIAIGERHPGKPVVPGAENQGPLEHAGRHDEPTPPMADAKP